MAIRWDTAQLSGVHGDHPVVERGGHRVRQHAFPARHSHHCWLNWPIWTKPWRCHRCSAPRSLVWKNWPAAHHPGAGFRPRPPVLRHWCSAPRNRDLSQRAERSSTLVEIPVHYNGEDLAEVAQILGITADEVVQRHTGSEYTVAFTGFAPGFAYLSGGHPSSERATPQHPAHAPACRLCGLGRYLQRRVPVCQPRWLANHWHHPRGHVGYHRAQPALLQPGYRVRFVDIATKKHSC